MALAIRAEAALGRTLEPLVRWLAYVGGAILTCLALLTVASILGRALLWAGLGPISGDFELVEAGVAIAIFAFLPWCQLKRGHVTVDIFIAQLPERAQAALGLVGDTIMSVIAAVILWRMWLGLGEKFPYGSDGLRAALGFGERPFFPETTYELELPTWIPFALATLGAAVFLAVCLYTVWRSLNWTLAGREGRA